MKYTRISVMSIVFVILVAGTFSSCRKAPETMAASDKFRLVWNDDPATNITIGWDQHEATNPVVMYGTEDFNRDFWKYKLSKQADRILDKYEMQTHFAQLTGLEPDQEYYFIIKDDSGVSERYWFRTAPDAPKPFTFIAGGDTKSEGDTHVAGQNTNKLVAKLRPLFVMFNGDFCTGNGTNAEYWHQWLNDWQELTTTEDNRMIPIFPVHGNHENGDHANLNYIFNSPYQNSDSARIYYSVSFGGSFMHLIALNSSMDPAGEQRAWLEKDLQEHKDFTFKMAGYHKPIWPHTSSKSENPDEYYQWAHLFYDNGLDISFDGDSHMSKITFPLRPDSTASDSYMGYIRDDSTGTMFLGEGSWGAFPRPNDDDKPWTIKSFRGNQVKWIHVFPKSGDLPDRMSIYTVMSATYDEQEVQTLYNTDVAPLSEKNHFTVPDNLKMVENGEYGYALEFPFHLNEQLQENLPVR